MTRLERREIQVSKANLGKTAPQDGFPGGSDGKESAYNEDRPGFDAWVGKILWRRERLPPPLFWIPASILENPMDRGAWPGYTTQRL